MKTYEEINRRIQNGVAVILTADEMSDYVEKWGTKKAAEDVDVVTTGTFGPMCSSGAIINFGQPEVPIKMNTVKLDGVQAYGSLASADAYIGATAQSEEDDKFGGAHVIEKLVKGEYIKLHGEGTYTDCKPCIEVNTTFNKDSVNECIMFNPRNAYQNYNAATNTSNKTLNTYLGVLSAGMGNVAFSGAGQLSPLLNDPDLITIGIGTRIFLCGASGFIVWNGTQFNTEKEKTERGLPMEPAKTLSVIGDIKQMSGDYIKAIHIKGYGVTLCVGIGIPIPILDESMAFYTGVKDSDIVTKIFDYSISFTKRPVIRKVTYKELKSGKIILNGKEVPSTSISSLKVAKRIADELKNRILRKEFFLTEPVCSLPKKSGQLGMKINNKI